MTPVKVLPLDRLIGACGRQIGIVMRYWPDGIPLTPSTAARLADLDLDLDWAASHLLPAEAHEEFLNRTDSSRARYRAAVGNLEARAEAVREYRRIAAHALLDLIGDDG